MKLIFDKAGKYMNNFHILEITEDHVKNEAVFLVDESNGADYVRVKKAHVFKEVSAQKSEPKKPVKEKK